MWAVIKGQRPREGNLGPIVYWGEAPQLHFSSIKRLALHTLGNHWLKKFHTPSPLWQHQFFVLFFFFPRTSQHLSTVFSAVLKGPSANRHLCSHWPTLAVVKVPMDHSSALSLAAAFQSWYLDHRLLYLLSNRWVCLVAGYHSNIVRNWVQLSKDVSVSSCTGFCWIFFVCLIVWFFATDAGCYWQKTEHTFLRVEEGKLFWKILWSTQRTHKSEPRTGALVKIL